MFYAPVAMFWENGSKRAPSSTAEELDWETTFFLMSVFVLGAASPSRMDHRIAQRCQP
jgi:hypothetical protein